MANISGTFTTTGTDGKTFRPRIGERITNSGAINIWLSGTATASVQLEKSPDNGVTWFAVYGSGTQLYAWSYANSGSGYNIGDSAEETEPGVIYRLNCTAFSSGTLSYQITGPV